MENENPQLNNLANEYLDPSRFATFNKGSNRFVDSYFIIAIAIIFAIAGFAALKIIDATTELTLIEGSFQGVIRNGEARLPAEIIRFTEETDLDLNNELNEIDLEIKNL